MHACAIIIVYSADLAITKKLISALHAQNTFCIIVDNSTAGYQQHFSARLDKLEYIHNGCNRGIAAAQNSGLRKAMALGFDWAFLFDQDSQIPAHFIQSMLSTLLRLNQSELRYAALGPQILCQHTQQFEKPMLQKSHCSDHDDVSDVPQIIASGMLMELQVLKNVGFHEEGLFIDAVDHEWCWRARNKGLRIGQHQHICLFHRLGESRVSIFGRAIKIGQPIRLYYQTRNLILLTWRGYVPLYWKLRNWGYLPFKLLINVFFVEQRWLRFKYTVKGILHGLLQKNGPM